MSLARLIVPLLAVVALVASGCGGEAESQSGYVDGPVQITVEGHSVTPVGEVVRAEPDQTVTLDVTSDAPAELHLHTDGDGKTFQVKPGRQRFTFSIATPGSYELEEHHTETVVLKVEVG